MCRLVIIEFSHKCLFVADCSHSILYVCAYAICVSDDDNVFHEIIYRGRQRSLSVIIHFLGTSLLIYANYYRILSFSEISTIQTCFKDLFFVFFLYLFFFPFQQLHMLIIFQLIIRIQRDGIRDYCAKSSYI